MPRRTPVRAREDIQLLHAIGSPFRLLGRAALMWRRPARRAEQSRRRDGAAPRFLLVTSNLPPVTGGSAMVYRNICRELPDAAVVLAASRDYQTGLQLAGAAEADAAAPFPVHRIGLLRPRLVARPRARALRLLGLLGDMALMARVFGAVATLVVRERISVLVIGDLVYLGWLALPARWLLGCRVVHYVHGEEITIGGKSLSERLKQSYLSAGDRVISVSNFTRTALLELMRVHCQAVTTIHNGVDLDRFQPRPPRPDLLRRYGLDGRRVVVSVGRLVPRKGFDTTLRAFPAILAACPDAHYLIVGDGAYRAELDALVREHGLSDRVTFAGGVPDEELADHYALGEVFVMPNRATPDGDTEGFGLVYLEANACGKPVVGGHDGGVPDAVVDGVTGLLVDGADCGQVAAAVVSILSDDALRARLAAGGLERARASGWASRAGEFARLLDGLARGVPVPALPPALPRPAPEARVDLSGWARPRLIVLVDAEEEFDWRRFSRYATSVATMRDQERAQRVFARFGVRPTYLVDYPVAAQPDGYLPLRDFLRDGACGIGTQLHPWVNPPFGESVGSTNSFPGNLPPALERDKLARLTDRIRETFGIDPLTYRAGRYGIGPGTAETLIALGYRIDTSVLPLADFRRRGGPWFAHDVTGPYWIDRERRLLELPATVGSTGPLAPHAERLQPRLGAPAATLLRVPGLMARSGLYNRVRLTPEGTTLDEARRVTAALRRQGQRLFVISYHSSSLAPGHTPYVRTEADLARFLAWLDGYLTYFFDEIGGEAAMPEDVLRAAETAANAA